MQMLFIFLAKLETKIETLKHCKNFCETEKLKNYLMKK